MKIVKTLDDKPQRSGGVCAQHSWQRIAEHVLTDREKKAGKKIVQVTATTDGVIFTIE